MDSSSRYLQNSSGMSVASLLSPPEVKKADSFSSPFEPVAMRTPSSSFSSDKPIVSSFSMRPAPRPYASPPISPYTNPHKENMVMVEDEGGAVQDPPLFGPGDHSELLPPNVPLFDNRRGSSELYADSIISNHIAKPDERFARVQRPSRDDYHLALTLKSIVASNYNQNPRAWLKQERAFLSRYGAQHKVVKRKALKKLAPAPSSTDTPTRKIAAAMPRTARVQRPLAAPRRTPQARAPRSSEATSSGSPSSPSQRQSTKASTTARDDVEFEGLPDLSPPLSTLPKNSSKTLKADWKPPSLDLSNDENLHLLDDSEKVLASTLRLSCAHYLTAKRRIFIARRDCLKKGKEFRKTDAQQACKIDVNKASKLWTAFDKVGWFNPEYFRQYLNQPFIQE